MFNPQLSLFYIRLLAICTRLLKLNIRLLMLNNSLMELYIRLFGLSIRLLEIDILFLAINTVIRERVICLMWIYGCLPERYENYFFCIFCVFCGLYFIFMLAKEESAFVPGWWIFDMFCVYISRRFW